MLVHETESVLAPEERTTMASAPADRPARPPSRGRRWSSFVADESEGGTLARGLHEIGNPRHRIRVEHDQYTLLLHLSDEDGAGWTTIAIDRATRQWTVAQDRRQSDTARSAYDALYD
jgi:hypothetical protein